MKHIFIINPAAGKYDHTVEFSQKIKEVFASRQDEYMICVSKKPGDCRAIARKWAETGEELRFYACGGDGTLNGVVNGAAGFDNVSVTHWPCGSGNDTIKMFTDYERFSDLEALLDGEEARFDLIRCGDVRSINILSIGFDARVANDVIHFKTLPKVTGKQAYLLSVGSNLFRGLSAHYVVTVNGETIDADETMICICNGRWYGGGFNPVPEAEPDDGILDVLLVKKVGLARAVTAIGDYQKGKYKKHPTIIRHVQCSELTIESDEESVVNVDGEIIRVQKADISVEPKAIRFVFPKGLHFRCGE